MKRYRPYGGPIWIDPRWLEAHGWPDESWGWRETTITTTGANTTPYPKPVTEDRLREIVREEIAELPIKYDVPDAPPESSDA